MTLKEIGKEMVKYRNLTTIIEKKKEEWTMSHGITTPDFIEKAIRESVEEALRKVRPTKADMEFGILARAYNKCVDAFDYRVKEFMK